MQQRIKLALITIGQTPRHDLSSDLSALWGDAFDIVQEGALDGLNDAQIKSLEPTPGESDLITRLADGRSVFVSHHRLESYVQAAISRASLQDVQIAIVACTGEFEGLRADIPILQPHNILEHSVAAVLERGKSLAVVVPTDRQAGEARKRWSERGYDVRSVHVVSPFCDKGQRIAQLAGETPVTDADAIVYDCFGFGSECLADFSASYRGPKFIARVLIAKLLTAIFPEPGQIQG